MSPMSPMSRCLYVNRFSREFIVEGNMADITDIAISPTEDNLICTLSNHQMYTLVLSNMDILKADEMNFDLLSTAYHRYVNI